MADPRPSAHVPLIDGARAVAAFLVLLAHAGSITGATERSPLGAVLARGDWGVALFFILSGFLLTRPWVAWRLYGGRNPSVKSYFRKRAVRILPAYWVALVAVFVLLPNVVTGRSVVSNILVAQVYTGDLLNGFFQTWSLSTEVAFYAVLPLLAPLLVRGSIRRSLVAVAAVALVAPAWIVLCKGTLFGMQFPYAILWLPGHIDWFCAGMALAILERKIRDGRLPRPLLGTGRWMAAFAVVAVLLLTPLAGPYTMAGGVTPATAVLKEFLYGASAFLVLGAMLQPGAPTTVMGRVLDSRFMVWAGAISYAFFLWHNLVMDYTRAALFAVVGSAGLLLTIVTTTVATIAVSALSYHLLEHPLMRRFGSAHPRSGNTQLPIVTDSARG